MRPQKVLMLAACAALAFAIQAGVGALALVALVQPEPPGPGVVQQMFPVEQLVALDERFAPEPHQLPVTPAQAQQLRGKVAGAGNLRISGPFTHAHLSVYLVHGPDVLQGQRIVTLQQALEQGTAVVHEGLSIDNRGDAPLFIQAGDLVKGGIQDRTLPYDQLIPAGAARVPLMAFCVEAGRSGPRGEEMSTSFQTAMEQLPGRRLHLAARERQSQTAVWNGVRETQEALSRSLGVPVQSPQSATSLQLTLENHRVHTAVQAYLDALAPRLAGEDAIGLVVAINGQVQMADVYGSAELFRALQPKLLRAHAVAALAEPGQSAPPPDADAVRRFLADAEQGTDLHQQLMPSGGRILRQSSAQALLFDTCDPGQANAVLHRSVLAR